MWRRRRIFAKSRDHYNIIVQLFLVRRSIVCRIVLKDLKNNCQQAKVGKRNDQSQLALVQCIIPHRIASREFLVNFLRLNRLWTVECVHCVRSTNESFTYEPWNECTLKWLHIGKNISLRKIECLTYNPWKHWKPVEEVRKR